MAIPELHARQDDRAFGAAWLVDAPWAHPAWGQYVIFLFDLTTPLPAPPSLVLEGATHEVLVYALDPAAPVDVRRRASDQRVRRLTPANHGYQFRAADDAQAVARIQAIVDQIDAKMLSPDTDVRRSWDALFRDGASLRQGSVSGEASSHGC